MSNDKLHDVAIIVDANPQVSAPEPSSFRPHVDTDNVKIGQVALTRTSVYPNIFLGSHRVRIDGLNSTVIV